ncbi:MAG: hypothetical protein HYR85_19920 [Planctomycetes bacterium]|nr:hypothetical protein [Planctomycetota bacterium]
MKLAYDRIIDACAQVLDGRPPGTELLSLHEAAASFFANAGATIENLGKCFEVKPVCSPIENYVRSRRSELDSIYDRRSQFVHQIIVPCFLTRHDDETLEPALNLDCLRFKQTTWVAPSIESVRTVDEYFRDTYEEFLAAVSDTWMHLFSKIKDAQISTKPAGPQNSVQVMPPIEWNQTSGSG